MNKWSAETTDVLGRFTIAAGNLHSATVECNALFISFSGRQMRSISIVAQRTRQSVVLLSPQVSGEHFPVIPKDTLKEMGYSGKRQTGHLSIRWATLEEEKKNRKRMEFSKNPCKLKKYWGSYRVNTSSQISSWPLTSYCHLSIRGYPPSQGHLVLLALPMPPYSPGAWFQREP